MKRRKVRKRLKRKPYLLDPWRIHSYSEARQQWEEEGYPSAASIFERARAKSDKAPEEWRRFSGTDPQRLSQWEEEEARPAPHLPRRILLLAALLTILSLFFACTPAIRAAIREAYNAVVEFFDQYIIIRSNDTEEQYGEIPVVRSRTGEIDGQTSFASLDDLVDYIQQDVYILEEYKDSIFSITLYSGAYTSLEYVRTEYHIGDKDIIVYIEQDLQKSQAQTRGTIEVEGQVYDQYVSKGGIEINGVYMAEEDMFTGLIIGQRTSITIDGITDPSQIDSILESLTLLWK